MKGKIHSFESFGSVDGPGVRFVVFLSGCPLRCKYCHNPDTWASPANMEMEAVEVLNKALRYKEYWGKDGGITASGGEPMLQVEFLIELFEKTKAKGVSTCLDTAGGPWTREGKAFLQFKRLMELTDIVLLDIKHMDSKAHRELTGAGNENILDFAKYLDEIKKRIWIRRVLVPNVTDDEKELVQMRKFIDSLSNVERVEVLPYHSMGNAKYKALKMSSPPFKPPTPALIIRTKQLLKVDGYEK